MPTKAEIDGLLPVSTRDVPSSQAQRIPQFDLTHINLVQIASDLSKELSRPQPEGWIRKWFRNKKLELDNDRLSWIETYIYKIRAINKELTQAQAELFIQPQILELLIRNKVAEANREIERQVADHKNYLSKVRSEMEAREILLENARIENLKKQAEVNLLNAQTEKEKGIANLINFVVHNIKFDKLPPAVQGFITVSVFNKNVTQYQDFDLFEKLKTYIELDAQGKAKQAMSLARQMESQARISEKSAEDAERRFEKSWNTPDGE